MFTVRASGAGLAMLLVLGCSSSTEPGVTVRIASLPMEPSGANTFLNDLGFEVRVDELHWTFAAVELVPCASSFQRFWDVVVPRAQAHGVGTPTRLAVPTVQGPGRDLVVLGELHPPAGQYCAVTVEFGPADADARGVDSSPIMLARSFHLRGAFKSGDDYEPFEVHSDAAIEHRLELALDLGSSAREANLKLSRDPQGWFSGIDFAGTDGTTLSQTILERFAASTLVAVE